MASDKCGIVIRLAREEAEARGEEGTPDPRVKGPRNIQVRCGKEAVLWRKEGLYDDFEVNPDSFMDLIGCCEEHAGEMPTHYNGIPVTMTRDEVVVWEVLTG